MIEFMSNKDDLMDCYQSLIITIEGYQDEEREPYQNRAFQNYFRRLFDEFPAMIWILLLDEAVITVQMMIWAYVNDNYTNDINDNTTRIIINGERAIQLLEKCFCAINKLTKTYAFDFSRDQDLTYKFQNIHTKSLGVPDSLDEKDFLT